MSPIVNPNGGIVVQCCYVINNLTQRFPVLELHCHFLLRVLSIDKIFFGFFLFFSMNFRS